MTAVDSQHQTLTVESRDAKEESTVSVDRLLRSWTEVLARTQLQVLVELRGELPERVILFYTTQDQRYVDEPIEMQQAEEGLKHYIGIIPGENGRGLLQRLDYYVVAGDAKTCVYHVRVIQPPSASVTQVHYSYPDYMNLDEKSQSDGHIDAWEGTTVTLNAQASMPVESAIVLFSDTEDVTIKAEEMRMQLVDGMGLRLGWKLAFRSDGTYPCFFRIRTKNLRGEVDPKPTRYNLTIRPDRPPEVVLLDPVRDLQMPANGIIPLLIEARDPDFMLRYVSLRIERDGEELSRSPTIFDGHQQTVETTYDFDLAPLQLKTGDTITYWIQARDNKQPLGNRKNTPRLNITIVDRVSDQNVQQQLAEDKQRQQQLQEARQENNEDGVDETQPQESAEQPLPPDQPQPEEGTPEAGQNGDQDQQKEQGSQKSEKQQSGSRQGNGSQSSDAGEQDENGDGQNRAVSGEARQQRQG